MDANQFYSKKFKLLGDLSKHLYGASQVLNLLSRHEDTAPGGDSQEEYSALFAALHELEGMVTDLDAAVAPMVAMEGL